MQDVASRSRAGWRDVQEVRPFIVFDLASLVSQDAILVLKLLPFEDCAISIMYCKRRHIASRC